MATRAVEHRCFIIRVRQDGSNNLDLLNEMLEKEKWQMFVFSENNQKIPQKEGEPKREDFLTTVWLRKPLEGHEDD